MASKSDRERYIAENSEYSFDEDLFTFNMVDASTVDRLRRDGDIKLPPKKVNVPKDERWNTKQMASKLMQGILQGDSIPKISQSFLDVVHNNATSATRAARTLVTQAENRGRIDSYRNLSEQGVVQEKVWIATPDSRTRRTHLDVDGETVGINDTFSNGLEYPADPSGDPAEVYNCRCSMRTEIVGFRRADGSISRVDYERDDTMHESQMEEERERRGIEKEEPKATPAPQISFTPAQTIEEAERFANETFIDGGFNLTGKSISYSGIDIAVANRINERLNAIYSQYDIQKLSSLEAYGKKNKRVYAQNADAPFFTTNFGNIGMNTIFVKSESQIEKYAADGDKAFQYVMDNINVLSGAQLEIAKAYQTAGRNLVDNSLEGMITHEIGHHISYMTNVNKDLAGIQESDWKEYAKNLSGYANHSFGEYVAESFTAYYNGDTSKLQPELIKVFEGLKK